MLSEHSELRHDDLEPPTTELPIVVANSERVSSADLPNKTEVQQIPHQGDKLIMVINFVLREVLTIQSREARLRLLNYYLGAILSESLLSPFTSLGYEVARDNNGGIALRDDIYQIRPDVLAVCESAVQNVVDLTERRRYSLEKDQIVRLIKRIEVLLTSGAAANSIIDVIGNETKPTQKTPSELDALIESGWAEAGGLITPEVAVKLDLPSPNCVAYVHQKIMYTMPQSEVHEGNMSVLVIAQPIYIPSINRVILLHDQCFFPADWSLHIKVWQRLGITVPDEIKTIAKNKNRSRADLHQIEEFFMMQLALSEDFKLRKPKDVFNQLLPEKKLHLAFKEWQKQRVLNEMKQSLGEYSSLLLKLMDTETSKGSLTIHQVGKISLFLKRVILAGILTHEQIRGLKSEELFALYYEHGHKSEENFVKAAVSGLGFSAAGRAIDLSLLECVSVGTINGFGLRDAFMKIKLAQGNFNREDIAKIIGDHRAKDWKDHQTCIACHASDVWVGECGLCLPCELHQSSIESPNTSAASPMMQPTKSHPELSVGSNQTMAVGNLIASLI